MRRLDGRADPGDSQEQRSRRFRLLLAYNLGRILSYACAGLLIGLAGWAVANSPAAMFLRILAGLLLIAMGLYLAGWWSGLTRIESLGRGLWRHIQPVANRLLPVSNVPRALLLGALWGWLPCGLVYSTLLWSASQGNALDSALLMLAFGLGTGRFCWRPAWLQSASPQCCASAVCGWRADCW